MLSHPQLSRLLIVLLNGELSDVKGADIILNVCIILLNACIEPIELRGSVSVYGIKVLSVTQIVISDY